MSIENVGIHDKDHLSISHLLEEIRSNDRFGEVGAIVSFIGVVRGTSTDGKEVKELNMEAYKDQTVEIFSRIAREIKKRPGIIEVLIHHVTGQLDLGDIIFVVMIAGSSRKAVFPALEETVEKVKRNATIWKKETLKTGESYWVEYT